MSTREKIIDAAMAIVAEQGVLRLTLDEAAKVAGLSKGGVLYHFKTKDDLIRAMVERQISICDGLFLQYYEEEAPGPYRWARTLVRMSFSPHSPANDPVGGALLAAAALSPDLLTPLRTKYDEWNERVHSDSPDPALATLVCMAMDGYYFEKLIIGYSCDDEKLERVRQTALKLLNMD